MDQEKRDKIREAAKNLSDLLIENSEEEGLAGVIMIALPETATDTQRVSDCIGFVMGGEQDVGNIVLEYFSKNPRLVRAINIASIIRVCTDEDGKFDRDKADKMLAAVLEKFKDDDMVAHNKMPI